MISMGQLGKNYERLSEDGAETLPMYEMAPKSDFASPSTSGTSVQLHASPTGTVCGSQTFDPKKYVPYRLELKKCGLFPEVLYYFKKNFGAESAENRAYCNLSLAEFTASYVGHENDILSSVARVEADFDQKFRKCLHPDLLQEFLEWTFTRGCVENEFREKLNDRGDLASGPFRLEALTRSMKMNKKVDKLVGFFKAFGYSEQFFWVYLMLVFSRDVSCLGSRKLYNSAAQKWQSEEGSLELRAQGFVEDDWARMPAWLKVFIIISGLFLVWFVIFAVFLISQEGKHH